MPASALSTSRNLLLQTISAEDWALVEPYLDRVPLELGQVLAVPNEPIEHLCFPEGAVTSVGETLNDGSRVEIGVVGLEGMTGWPVLLGCKISPHEAMVQVGGGSALRIETGHLLEACRRSESLRTLLLRFVQTFSIQMGRTLASNLRDPVERRLSRWLLMCHDRLDGDEMELTHKFISIMLGVRRATVTDSLHILEGTGAIRGQRGRILVRDRKKLEAFAGEAYGFAEDHYGRLIAPFGKNGTFTPGS